MRVRFWVSAVSAAAMLSGASAQAQTYDVRIRRDTWGVPHILGKTDADAAYGLGFANAEDDFATIQESLLTGRGKLAAFKGASGAPSDLLVAHLRVAEQVAQRYETDLSPALRKVVEGYAAGITHYAELHPDKVSPLLGKVTGRDIAAFTAFRGPSFYGLDGDFGRVATGRTPDLTQVASAESERGSQGEIGSNAVAVGPSRSADRHTRLLSNSHQPWEGPVTFFEAVVESREGWHVAGSFFPASPFLLGGHNAHMGWGATVNHPDLVDIYKLEMNPANPNQYRLDGQWRDLERRMVGIDIKQADGTMKTESREVLRSVHGPAIRNAKGVYALRYPTSGNLRQLPQYYAMNKARTLAEWKAAMAIQGLPSINYLYADDKGNIGYLSNGIYAVKKAGVDWTKTVPGDRSDLIWTQTRKPSEAPQIWNPKSGFLFNSNNTPLRATDGTDDMKAFPPEWGIQPADDMTNRAFRAIETYGADKSITAAEFEAYKYDIAYSLHSDEFAWVKEVLAVDPAGDADLKTAQDVLRKWDGRADLENRGTAMVALMWLQRRQHGDWKPIQMLKESLPLLKKAYGRVDPKWGEVNRLRRGKLDLPVDGGPDTFRALYGRPDPDGRLHGVNGDCWFMFMDWDPQGRLVSRAIHQYGSATLDASSPHYADQSPLFARHETRPVWFTEAQLKGHIEREYRP